MTIDEIKTRIDQLERSKSEIDEDIYNLSKSLVDAVMADKDIINESSWTMDHNMTCCIKSTSNKHLQLFEILNSDYHQHINAGYCNIYFSDGDVAIVFEEEKRFDEFIRNNNVNISSKQVKSSISYTEERIKDLQDSLTRDRELLKMIEDKNAKSN